MVSYSISYALVRYYSKSNERPVYCICNKGCYCTGETGLGKSTLMDSLFNTSFESNQAPHTLPNVKLKAHTYELQESNVRLKVSHESFSVVWNKILIRFFFELFQLTIVDTVGYGDQINKEDSYKAVVDYIDNQFEAYLQEELKIKRTLHSYHDTRIHVCLYFICPTGHGFVVFFALQCIIFTFVLF